MTYLYVTEDEAKALLVYCEEDIECLTTPDGQPIIYGTRPRTYFLEEACARAIEELKLKSFPSIHDEKSNHPGDAVMAGLWGTTGTVDCPTCNGTGQAEVGLTGFTRRWIAKCPDCGGEGKLYAMEAYTVKQRLDRRRMQGRPQCPPSGCY